MATKKKLLQAAAGSASGGEGLNVEDVFSTYLYEGNGSSQTIDNGIGLGEGGVGSSVYFDGTDDYLSIASDASLGFGTGDFTIECWIYPDTVPTTYLGIVTTLNSPPVNGGVVLGTDSSGNITFTINSNSGTTITANTTSTKYAANQWQHLALTRESGTVRVWLDGTQIGTDKTDTGNAGGTVPALVSSFYTNSTSLNFDGYISNLRFVKGTALYTSNFTPPTEQLTNITNTSLLTCQSDSLVDNSSNSHTVTANNDARVSAFGPFDGAYPNQGGLVWTKIRTQTDSHYFWDTERGVNKRISPNQTYAENTETTALTSFNSNGFNLGDATNVNGSSADWGGAADYASWTFRKAPKFFTCLTYTGDGVSGRSISHDLGTTVGCIIVKRTDASAAWSIYHRGMDATAPQDYALEFNSSARTGTANRWADTAPTSTTFTVGSDGEVNASGGTYVAYLFAHNDGDGDFGDGTQDIIKCGSFTGTGATNNFVNLGFEPQWIMFKNTSVSEEWFMFDNMRGTTVGNDVALYADLSNAEGSPYDNIDFNATGFTLKDTYWGNRSGSDYIYIAIRRGPMAVPTDATDVFQPYVTSSISSSGSTTSSSSYDVGFPVDLLIQRNKDGTDGWYAGTRLTGAGAYLKTESTAAEASSAGIWWDSNISAWNYASTYGTYNWKRAPNYFDVVAYTGNGTAGRTVSHNLGVAPEMIWVKVRSTTGSWRVYTQPTGNTGTLRLDSTSAFAVGSTYWNNTDPSATEFTLGTANGVNQNGQNFIAYLFASLDGVSKVGSYTGTGSQIDIDCGFTAGARFVLVKKTSSTSNWDLFDTERGIVSSANDPRLELNTTDAEATATDFLEPYSGGFTIIAGSHSLNNSGASYVYYAIA